MIRVNLLPHRQLRREARQRQFGLLLLKTDLLQHCGLRVLQQAVNAPQNEHGQNDISIFPAHKDIPQAVVSNGPDEGDNLHHNNLEYTR